MVWVRIAVTLLAALAGGAGALFLLFGVGDWRRRREVRRTPTTALRDVKPGVRVEVSGAILPQGTIDAPITGLPCVLVRWNAEVRLGSGEKQALDGHAGDALWLKDETGAAQVVLKDADFSLPADQATTHEGEPERDAAAEARVIELARARGIEAESVTSWHERRVEAGSPLYVLGGAELAREAAPDGVYRDAGRLLVFRDGLAGGLFVSAADEGRTVDDLSFGVGCGLTLGLFALAVSGALFYLAWYVL